MAYVQHSTVLPFPKEKVFEYLTDVSHFPELLPSDYHLSLTAPPLAMKRGAEYEFKLNRFGVTHLLSTKVEDFKEDEGFTERQILGLFDSWIHTCQVEDHSEGTTLLTNSLEYEVPLGLFGRLLDDLWLRRDLKRIFEVGHKKLEDALQ